MLSRWTDQMAKQTRAQKQHRIKTPKKGNIAFYGTGSLCGSFHNTCCNSTSNRRLGLSRIVLCVFLSVMKAGKISKGDYSGVAEVSHNCPSNLGLGAIIGGS
jgi:hypothetical protein